MRNFATLVDRNDRMRVNLERWAAASGYVVVFLGVAGAALEGGGPPLNAPVDQTVACFSTYRGELLAQSLMFVLSAGAYLWFFGVPRAFLVRARDYDGDGRDARPASRFDDISVGGCHASHTPRGTYPKRALAA